jgi:pimeloyl-ACP methyl ester carboxylesterase
LFACHSVFGPRTSLRRETDAKASRVNHPGIGLRRGSLGVVLIFVVLIAGCTSSATNSGSAKGFDSEPQPSFAGLVDIGHGRKMHLECKGTGHPTVVLVPGLDSATDAWTTSEAKSEPPVFEAVARFTRVCTYDRPGVVVGDAMTPSPSTPVPQPTTPQDGVRDLHLLLQASREPGPYVLVGHSYGGLITRIYTAEYHREVVGLVFVDAFAPQWESSMTPAQWEITKAITGPTLEQIAHYPDIERIDFDASVAEARRAAPPSRSLPVIVLSRDTRDRPMGPAIASAVKAGKLPAFVPVDFGYVIDEAWNKAQDALARLVPNAKHIVVKGSGHNIQLEYPQSVTNAIHQVFDKAAQ